MYKILIGIIFITSSMSFYAIAKETNPITKYKINKTNDEWKKSLSKEEYYVLREKGTERAFTGAYHNNNKKGIYYCKACGSKLFDSKHKFDSGTGWPSFYKPIDKNSIEEESDYSFFMIRTEVKCKKCGSHLGHVFDDGPNPTGLRYCINSISLKFKQDKK